MAKCSSARQIGSLRLRQAVAVLREDVAYVAQAGLVALALLEQPDIGSRGAGVGVVAALLPLEVHLGVRPSGVPLSSPLRLKL